jgi:hypothetical protein
LIFIVLEKIFNLYLRSWYIEEPTVVVLHSVDLEEKLLEDMLKELKG